MKPPASKTALWSLLAAVFFICAIWVALHHGRGPIPLSESPRLHDVVEPITIVDGMSLDDGGSRCLRFRDSRGTIKDLCLVVLSFDNPGPPPVLAFDSFDPTRRPIPTSDVDERALLGLLERWAVADPEARELERRYDLHEIGRITSEDFWKGLPRGSRVKETAVNILRTLRSRN